MLLFDEDVRGDGLRCEGRLRDSPGRDAPRLRLLSLLVFLRAEQLLFPLMRDVYIVHPRPDSGILATDHVPAASKNLISHDFRL